MDIQRDKCADGQIVRQMNNTEPGVLMDKQTDGQTERRIGKLGMELTDRWTEGQRKQMDRQKEKEIDRRMDVQMDRQTEKEIDKWRVRWTDRQKKRQIDKRMCRRTDRHKRDRQANGWENGQTDRKRDTQADRKIYRHTKRQTDRRTCDADFYNI